MRPNTFSAKLFVLCIITFAIGFVAKETPKNVTDGQALFATVKQFVAIGEHRTATKGDSITAIWLKSKFDSLGASTKLVDFPLEQFFFESGYLKLGNKSAEVFPVWPVKKGLNLSINGFLVNADKTTDLKDIENKIAYTKVTDAHGSTTPKIESYIKKLISSGAIGVLLITENSTGEIMALNTYEGLKAWDVPVYHIAPKDTNILSAADAEKSRVAINVSGEVKNTIANNIYAKMGNGSKYVVISTPISGWFTTGGERGPGIAIWIGLGKWVKANASLFKDYTFIFTGHSGHELSGLGAKTFISKSAPKPSEIKLWVHLGAGVAVKSWKVDKGVWTLTEEADTNRYIYYDESVAESFEKTFKNVKAKTLKGIESQKETIKPGGEGVAFKKAGYTNLVSIAYAHRLHHVRSDNEYTTSPQILADLQIALQAFIYKELSK